MSDTSPAVDLDLRLVHCFTLVAEYGHFGRAAEALHVTQPSLSRQINRLEKQLGVRLLDRGPQGSRLTEAGAIFLPQARTLLRTAGRVVAQTRAAARPGHITIGYTGDLIITPVVREMRRRHPDAEIRARHVQIPDVPAALLDHRVDALVTRLPFPTEGLQVTILYEEPRVVVMPIDHRLAHKQFVTLDDIADEPIPRIPDCDPTWSAYWRIDPRPDGRPAPDGPIIAALEDKVEVIAAGEAIAIAAGGQFASLRPDITAVPLHGVDPAHVVLATLRHNRNRLIAAFGKCAQEQLTGSAPSPIG